MTWNIITDTSCDIRSLNQEDAAAGIHYYSVPFIFSIGGREFIDDDTMDIEELLSTMEADKNVSRSACPSVASWLEYMELEGNTIVVTISKNLSGSYSSACAAMNVLKEEHPEKKVAVINSASAGPGLSVIVRELCKDIRAGKSFEEVQLNAEKNAENNCTIFMLNSFNNLVKNGRMSPFLGLVAGKLGIWGVGRATPEGTIEIVGKGRNAKKAMHILDEDMKKQKKEIHYVFISHCQNEEIAREIADNVRMTVPGAYIEIEATKGLCSFYAERHGLVVAYA